MTALEYKAQAMEWLESGDEQLAKMVYVFIKTMKDEGENPTMGHVGRTPITQQDIEEGIKASNKAIEEGDYMTIEEFAKTRPWK